MEQSADQAPTDQATSPTGLAATVLLARFVIICFADARPFSCCASLWV